MASGCAPPKLEGFILTEKLGSGTYATVYKAYRKVNSREVVAIKCVSKKSLNKASVENLLTEIEILKTVRHAHIVQLKDFQWDNENIYLIMEFCAGGDLSRFIRSRRTLPERVARRFLQQLGTLAGYSAAGGIAEEPDPVLVSDLEQEPCAVLVSRTHLGGAEATFTTADICRASVKPASALQYLHQRNISHLDLKPQNVLLSSLTPPHLKLADFGFAQHMSPWDEKYVLRGSPLYMAPEMVCRQQYDARVDLWSVGVILYEALFGRPPFASKSFTELEEKIRSNKAVELPPAARVSGDCRNLLPRLLERDPEQRITFEEFFTHPFVDLDHMPNAESLEKATALVVEAVKKDQLGDYSTALSFYCKSLEYFVPALHCPRTIPVAGANRDSVFLIDALDESDRRRKTAIRSKVTQYISRAEELKTLVAVNNKANFQQAKSARDVLKEMSQDKPQLVAALEIGSAAVAKEEEGNDSVETLDLYQQSLGELLLILASEPQGRRRVILHKEIQNLMSRAEYLKEQLKMRESQNEAASMDQDPFSDSIKSNCSLQ